MFFEDWKNKEKMEIFKSFTMQTEIIWRKQFKQSSAFNITPIADPFNPNYFYVGGGAEDDYGKYTRLRRLSFATGEEEASVSLLSIVLKALKKEK